MGQLTVRKLDDELIRRLKIRAAEHGRSAEAEHREILKQALAMEAMQGVAEWLHRAKAVSEKIGPLPDESWRIIRKFRDER
jgi:plasmid stability protein